MYTFRLHPIATALLMTISSPLWAEKSDTLEPITIRATNDSATNFTTPDSTTATGLNLSQRETPQSISVITEKQLKDQNATTFSKALEQAPSIYRRIWGNSSSGYNFYLSRSYEINNFRIDGANVQGISGSQAMNNTDSAIYESVSLVRGSTGLTSGVGNPGGLIELTRKKPTTERQFSAEVGGGSWKHYRTVLDGSGALNSDGSLRGRSIVVYDMAVNGSVALNNAVLPYTAFLNTILRQKPPLL